MDQHDAADGVSRSGFWPVMAGLPGTVAVVTTVDSKGEPQGVTCTSLCRVSADPQLLLVCVGNHSRTLAALRDTGFFAVNLLHQHGREAALTFASGFEGQFRSVLWAPSGQAKVPLLIDDAHSVAECRVWSTAVAGDHTVVIGEVRTFERLRSEAPLTRGVPPGVSG